MSARVVLILAIVLSAAKEVSAQESAKKEQDPLQGTWLVVRALNDGHKYPPEKTKSCKIVIAGDKLTVQCDKPSESKVTLDSTKKPQALDVTPADGPDKGMVLKGIYELKGDELKICLSKPGRDRPTEFASKENSGIVLIELKREKQ